MLSTQFPFFDDFQTSEFTPVYTLFIRIIGCSSDSKQLFVLLLLPVFSLFFHFSPSELYRFERGDPTRPPFPPPRPYVIVPHSLLTPQVKGPAGISQASFSAQPRKVAHLRWPVAQAALCLQILDQCFCKFQVFQNYLYI